MDELEDDFDLEDDYLDELDETIPVCPECGSDDLGMVEDTLSVEYECQDCGEVFSDEEDEDERSEVSDL